MPSRNLIMLAVAAGIAIVAVLLANAYFSGFEERRERQAATERLVPIVVASSPLQFGTPLTSQNLHIQPFPAGSVPQGAFSTVAAAIREGKVALRPMVVGEPVLASKVAGKSGRATLAAILPPGTRAVSLPIGAVSGVAGFVLPGTTVDVLLTRKIEGDGATSEDMRSDVILQNVPVLAVDQTIDQKTGKPKIGKTATVQVSLFDAQRLAIADKVGDLSLALRNIGNDAAPTELAAQAGTATNRDLGGARFYIRARNQGGERPQVATQTIILPSVLGKSGPSDARPFVPTGPTMTVFRGTEATQQSVGSLGGY